ncbi:MAG: ATP-dependent zinc metalloprotease FtsH [Thermotogae bacterium]|nr:ATP-dependent zinc metalloprotease FtsH [Thermotogota bacterium]
MIILLLIIAIRAFFSSADMARNIGYSDFLKMVESPQGPEEKIVEIRIKSSGDVRAVSASGEIYQFNAPWLLNDSQLVQKLADKGIKVVAERSTASSFWVNVVGTILPFAIILLLWMLMMRAFSGRNSQAFSFTRSPARKFKPEERKVTFKDVAGVDEAVEELKMVVEFLKNPRYFTSMGARVPKGILLVGPPGTGKTLLARAVAGEAGVPFFYISGSDFVELFVGVGAARVRDLFNQAKANAPAIVFIDEIDAVGRQRGAGLGGGHDEREQTLNQLLVEMDGFDPNEGIVVMAATNRPDILDKALLRPGRFDKKVVVDPPDVRGRAEILKIHMRGKPIAEDVDVDILARRTPGFVGADLENLVNEAALLAIRRGKKKVTMSEFEEAIDMVIAGPARKSRIISPKEKKTIAYHEVGHAIVSTLLPNADPVHRISIIPRGYRALGYTLQLPLEDKYLSTKSEILDKITGLLGGRAAEEIAIGEISTGSSNDIERATEMARQMVCKFGMSEALGPAAWGKEEEEVFLGRDWMRMRNYSEEIAARIDEEVRKIVEQCYEKAKRILQEHREEMDEIVEILLEKEVIEGNELRKLLKKELRVEEDKEAPVKTFERVSAESGKIDGAER